MAAVDGGIQSFGCGSLFVKVLLQDQCGSVGIVFFSPFEIEDGRGVPLIDMDSFDAETAFQPVGETAAMGCHLMFCAIWMAGQPNDSQGWPPFFQQGFDGSEFPVVGFFMDDGQGTG